MPFSQGSCSLILSWTPVTQISKQSISTFCMWRIQSLRSCVQLLSNTMIEPTVKSQRTKYFLSFLTQALSPTTSYSKFPETWRPSLFTGSLSTDSYCLFFKLDSHPLLPLPPFFLLYILNIVARIIFLHLLRKQL